MSAPTQPNANPNPSDPNGGGGNTPPTDPKGSQPGGQQEVDLAKLSGDQLAKVLENPELWKQPRIAELLEAKKQLGTLTEQQKQQEEKQLAENRKFEELATRRGEEINTLKGTIKQMQITQALTAKLVPEGVVDLEAALKLADTSKLEISDDGTVKGIEDVIEALKKDKAYLFNKQSGVGNPTNPGNESGPSGPPKFKRSQLSDPKFYNDHREEIIDAMKKGLIEDDIGRK